MGDQAFGQKFLGSLLTMKPPIIVLNLDEGGTPMFFKSREDAERYIEPVDVNNGEYAAYDGEGRQLLLRAFEDKGARAFGRFWTTGGYVVIEDAEQEPRHVEELRHALLAFLNRHAATGDWADAPLKDIIEKAVTICGWS